MIQVGDIVIIKSVNVVLNGLHEAYARQRVGKLGKVIALAMPDKLQWYKVDIDDSLTDWFTEEELELAFSV
jgi:hypothetical protein